MIVGSDKGESVMKRCDITAVVVTYNRKELLMECLEALEKQKASPGTVAKLVGLREAEPPRHEPHRAELTIGGGFHFHVLVVDNASTDGTEEWIRPYVERHAKQVSYLRLDENLGGAGGFVRGMKTALSRDTDYIWIMDDDTIPQNHALERLLETIIFLQDKEQPFGFLSSEALWTDQTPCKMNQQTPVKVRDEARKKRLEEAHLEAISGATFVSLLIPAKNLRKYGLPLADYFIWGDDKEFTLRLSDALPCYKVRDSIVIHKTKNNSGSNIAEDDLERIHRYYYAYRNDLATAKKRGAKEVLIYELAYGLNTLRVIFGRSDGKGKRLAVMRQGRKDGKNFSPEVEFPE
jgi:GT2 family glycosyltransferase